MLDDGNTCRQQDRVDRPFAGAGVVDVDGIDAHHRCAAFDEQLGGTLSEVRVARVAVALGSPVLRPAGVHEHRPTGDVEPVEVLLADLLRTCRLDENTWDRGHASEVEAGEVVAVGEAVERSVEVGAGVGDHVDPADLELGPLGVALTGCLPTEVVADHRTG